MNIAITGFSQHSKNPHNPHRSVISTMKLNVQLVTELSELLTTWYLGVDMAVCRTNGQTMSLEYLSYFSRGISKSCKPGCHGYVQTYDLDYKQIL